MFFIYDCENKLVAKTEANSIVDAEIKVADFFGEDSGHTVEEDDLSWSDVPELDTLSI